jgi:hypothetical protein
MLLLIACNGSGAGFPQIANPPPFDYVDGQELRAGMHQLAFELQQLDLVLVGELDQNPAIQRDVVESLEEIERLAGVIRDRDLSANHTFLDDDMERFLASVSRARAAAERVNPSYYSAGRVSGACVNCHRINQ